MSYYWTNWERTGSVNAGLSCSGNILPRRQVMIVRWLANSASTKTETVSIPILPKVYEEKLVAFYKDSLISDKLRKRS